jgi:diguanylate cyclase (GGDEF)-like protein
VRVPTGRNLRPVLPHRTIPAYHGGMPNRGLWRLVARLERLPDPAFAALCLLLIVLVTLVDWFGGAEIAATQAYLLPISLAGWCRGRRVAIATSAISALTWLGISAATSELFVTVQETVNATVLFLTYALFGQLIAQLRRQINREHRLAHTDALTEIHNRRAFWAAATREIERCRRYRTPFALAYLDVDAFKSVNDRFGHQRGDDLLRAIADLLRVELREIDMVARLGGDEFAVLLPGADAAGTTGAAARLLAALRAMPERRTLGIDFSLGCVTVLDPPADVDSLVASADALMYEMKHSGPGQVRHEVLRAQAETPSSTALLSRRRRRRHAE